MRKPTYFSDEALKIIDPISFVNFSARIENIIFCYDQMVKAAMPIFSLEIWKFICFAIEPDKTFDFTLRCDWEKEAKKYPYVISRLKKLSVIEKIAIYDVIQRVAYSVRAEESIAQTLKSCGAKINV